MKLSQSNTNPGQRHLASNIPEDPTRLRKGRRENRLAGHTLDQKEEL